MSEEDKKMATKMKIINNALEDGWTVKKSSINTKTFEFSKCGSKNKKDTGNYNIIITKNNMNSETIINHLNILNEIKNNKNNKLKKSVSTPV